MSDNENTVDYIVTKVINTPDSTEFFVVGHSTDKKRAARIAANEYKAYNSEASGMNVTMIEEYLWMKGEYSFRKDKSNRIQLNICEMGSEELRENREKPVFRCISADDMLREIASSLSEGRNQASLNTDFSCPGK